MENYTIEDLKQYLEENSKSINSLIKKFLSKHSQENNYSMRQEEKCFAGGALSHLIYSILYKKHSPIVNDIDIFVNIPSDSMKNLEQNEEYVSPYYAYRIEGTQDEGVFNTVYVSSIDSVPNQKFSWNNLISSFDLNCVQVGYDIDNEVLFYTDQFLNFLLNKEILFNNSDKCTIEEDMTNKGCFIYLQSIIRAIKKSSEYNALFDKAFHLKKCLFYHRIENLEISYLTNEFKGYNQLSQFSFKETPITRNLSSKKYTRFQESLMTKKRIKDLKNNIRLLHPYFGFDKKNNLLYVLKDSFKELSTLEKITMLEARKLDKKINKGHLEQIFLSRHNNYFKRSNEEQQSILNNIYKVDIANSPLVPFINWKNLKGDAFFVEKIRKEINRKSFADITYTNRLLYNLAIKYNYSMEDFYQLLNSIKTKEGDIRAYYQLHKLSHEVTNHRDQLDLEIPSAFFYDINFEDLLKNKKFDTIKNKNNLVNDFLEYFNQENQHIDYYERDSKENIHRIIKQYKFLQAC